MPNEADPQPSELESLPAPPERQSQSDPIENEDGAVHHQSLPPCDGGKAAWRLLLVVFVFEALLWGFPLSFGVFQNYYSQLPQFKGQRYISVVGTTATGIPYLAAPFMIPLIKRYERYRRPMIWVGWPICLGGLVAGSFARTVGSLIITQGLMYAFGFIIFYYPLLSMVNEYWIARRGMAYGFLCSASGASGAAMPFATNALLHRYGYPTTLRAIAVGLFVTTGPLIPFLKGRVPESEVSTSARTDWSFLKRPLFWIYSASNLAMGLGYFFPSLYLPSYATANGMSSLRGALLLAVMSVSQVLGQFSFGYLSDKKLSINLLAISATLISAVAAYTSWGLAHTFEVLVVFAMLYGFFGAGYTAMWARMGTRVGREGGDAFQIFGLLNMGKGVGNVLSGVIGGALLSNTVRMDDYAVMKYRNVVLFTGSCMLLSAATIPLQYLKGSIHFNRLAAR